MADTTRSDDAAAEPRDNAILPLTRQTAAAVIPFLVTAFLLLYPRPAATAALFAWTIASPLTAALMGAGYLGGAYFFARVLAERRWHCIGGGFPPVAVFTLFMLAATLLHWDTFDPRHWPFLVWLALYVVTPVLVTVVWRQNRRRDPAAPEPGDPLLPPATGVVMVAAAALLVTLALVMFALPNAIAAQWPWPLTPLTARVLAGWLALLGVGALTLRAERRWSAWRIPLQSIVLWQALLAVAFLLHRDGFGPGGPLNWFTLFTLGGLLAAVVFYLRMERHRGSADA